MSLQCIQGCCQDVLEVFSKEFSCEGCVGWWWRVNLFVSFVVFFMKKIEDGEVIGVQYCIDFNVGDKGWQDLVWYYVLFFMFDC